MNYHFNPKTGTTGICKATQQCRFALSKEDHYASKEEAAHAYERKMANEIVIEPLHKIYRPELYEKFAGIGEEEIYLQMQYDIEPLDAMLYNKRPEEIPHAIVRFKNNELKEEIKASWETLDLPIAHVFTPVAHDGEEIARYNEELKAFRASCTSEELRTLHSYTGLSFMNVNNYLFDKDWFIEDAANMHEDIDSILKLTQANVETLDKIIARHGVSRESRRLYRAFTPSSHTRPTSYKSSQAYAEELGLIAGEEVEFKNFLSTSIDPAYIADKLSHGYDSLAVVVVFESREGVPASDSELSSSRSNPLEWEREILLPRNKKFMVKSVERSSFQNYGDDDVSPLTVIMQEVS